MSRTLRAYTNFSDIVIETTSLDSASSLSLSLFRGNCYATLCCIASSCREGYYQGALSELQATGKTRKLQRFLLDAQLFIFSLLDFYDFA